MSLSMRECIRWLKKEISEIVEEDPPLADECVCQSWIYFVVTAISQTNWLIFRLETVWWNVLSILSKSE